MLALGINDALNKLNIRNQIFSCYFNLKVKFFFARSLFQISIWFEARWWKYNWVLKCYQKVSFEAMNFCSWWIFQFIFSILFLSFSINSYIFPATIFYLKKKNIRQKSRNMTEIFWKIHFYWNLRQNIFL